LRAGLVKQYQEETHAPSKTKYKDLLKILDSKQKKPTKRADSPQESESST
jgi:hypothetical protein